MMRGEPTSHDRHDCERCRKIGKGDIRFALDSFASNREPQLTHPLIGSPL